MGALLPFAVAWHVTYVAAIAAALIGSVTLAASCHVARELRLNALVIFPDLAQLPELAPKWLRQTAAPTQPPRRFDCCRVLPDRVAAVRPALLQLAGALERNTGPDPASVALVHELLTDGCGPLYNPNVPTEELRRAITRASAGI
jgi:hypothetical protein